MTAPWKICAPGPARFRGRARLRWLRFQPPAGSGMRFFLNCLAGLAVGLAMAGPAAEFHSPDSYLLRRWSSEDGLNWGDIKALARTPDGFLWIATDLGLVRFDGVQFLNLDAGRFPIPVNDRVSCLLADRQGRLWVGTEEGRLLRGAGGIFQVVAAAADTLGVVT